MWTLLWALLHTAEGYAPWVGHMAGASAQLVAAYVGPILKEVGQHILAAKIEAALTHVEVSTLLPEQVEGIQVLLE